MNRKYYNAKSFKDIANLYYLDSNGNKKTEKITQREHSWYFCITKEDGLKHSKLIKGLIADDYIKAVTKDGDFFKIHTHKIMYDDNCDANYVIMEFKSSKIKMFENDLKIHDRILIDKQLLIEDKHKIGHWDIETDDRREGIVPGRDRILSMAIYNRNGKINYFTGRDERALLEEALSVMKTFTIITGWHSTGFDMPCLIERCNVNDIRFPLWDINHLDLLVWFKKAVEAGMLKERPRNYKLETVCDQYLNMKKTEGVKAGGGRIWNLFENNPAKLKEYNIQDVNLLNLIDVKLGIVDQCIKQSMITKSFVGGLNLKQGICTPSELIDKFVLNLAFRNGRRLLCKNNNAKKTTVKRFVKVKI